MKATSVTPSLRVAIAIGFASMLAIASSPAWSQSLIGDGWAGPATPPVHYRSGRTQPLGYSSTQNQGNADWR